MTSITTIVNHRVTRTRIEHQNQNSISDPDQKFGFTCMFHQVWKNSSSIFRNPSAYRRSGNVQSLSGSHACKYFSCTGCWLVWYTNLPSIHTTKISLFAYQSYQLRGFLENYADKVSSQCVPRSFLTKVVSYHFGHFVPTFILILGISYPVWLFRIYF